MRLRRALLYTPGDSRRKIEKAATLNVDSVVLDLEDGVALNNKAAARETVAAALRELDFGRTERIVRTNAVIDDGLHVADIEGTIEGRPDAYLLPKIESARQVQEVSWRLEKLERHYGWPTNSIALLVMIETARGIVNLRDIASSDPRLTALVFGAEDLAGDIGAVRTPEGWEVFYARSAVVLHARAFGLQAVDMVHVDLGEDQTQLVAETEQAVSMGYTGKQAIHPRQVEVIQRSFTPTPEQIDHARRLVAAHHAHQAARTGAFDFEGKMVDMPVVRAAQAVLERARAAGIEVDAQRSS
jgi:citrate lyase beta subunit